MRYLIEQINETQDGRPLSKYIDTVFDGVEWHKFKAHEDMSTCDALNLLLLKIAASDTPAEDMEYVQKQLSGAALVVYRHVLNHVEFPPPPWDEVRHVAEHMGRCPACHKAPHTTDCR